MPPHGPETPLELRGAVVVMRLLYNESFTYIGQKLDINAGTASRIFHRARERAKSDDLIDILACVRDKEPPPNMWVKRRGTRRRARGEGAKTQQTEAAKDAMNDAVKRDAANERVTKLARDAATELWEEGQPATELPPALQQPVQPPPLGPRNPNIQPFGHPLKAMYGPLEPPNEARLAPRPGVSYTPLVLLDKENRRSERLRPLRPST